MFLHGIFLIPVNVLKYIFGIFGIIITKNKVKQ